MRMGARSRRGSSDNLIFLEKGNHVPNTPNDPLFGTSQEPIAAARKGAAVVPSDNNNLSNVTSSLIVTIGTGGTGMTVIYADGTEQTPVLVPLAPGTTIQLFMQVKRVMATGTALGTGGGIVAQW